ncbi:hypothetical protein DYB35_007006 [Aphanomyces astaci]|uniref:Uncharacterized protein n=1 Tax=Aphanomyces astaci TaxID=112090 RepID=A0A3R7BSE1_APHAT|nr:hypothetical protein DYB35_007006 [Aphanomyces astaci]
MMLGVIVLLLSTTLGLVSSSSHRAAVPQTLKQRCFPDDFLLGTATAAYQVEGGWNLTGRTPSIWDDFCRSRDNVQCANVADDMIHRYVSDIAIMQAMGLSSFRFSISWSRVMTWHDATQRMVRNDAGIAFYHDLLDAMRAAQLTSVVTLYHWDLPSALHTHMNGWLNASIVGHFNQYAELMYDEYGAKVDFWTTFNEPWSFCVGGYGGGWHAPGITDSDTATYVAPHHVLLAHATAVQTHRSKHLSSKIGITLNSDMALPLDPTDDRDVEAAERKLQFSLGWFLNPIVHGDYPAVMKRRAGHRLPRFTAADSALLTQSYDVFMLNHYSTNVVTDCASTTYVQDVYMSGAIYWTQYSYVNCMPCTFRLWTYVRMRYPQGYLPLIRWMHAFNKSAPILLTENGWCGHNVVDNPDQLWYFESYLAQVWLAVAEGVPVIGYTAWSFVDNYEWGSFDPRFGLFHVEFPPETGTVDGFEPKSTDLTRTARPAATWYGQVASTKCFPLDEQAQGPTPSTDPLTSSTTSHWVQGAVTVGFVGPMLVAVMALAALVYRKQQQQHRSSEQAGENSPLVPKH